MAVQTFSFGENPRFIQITWNNFFLLGTEKEKDYIFDDNIKTNLTYICFF